MRFLGILLAACLIAGSSSCGDDTDVCAAQIDAADACTFMNAPRDTCEDNLAACSEEELAQWVDYFDCLRENCEAEEPQIVVEQVCAGELTGISWDCTPGGTGI